MFERFRPDPRLQVRKRDGGLEPFAFVKLVNCIRNALETASGGYGDEPGDAVGLAEAVHQCARESCRNGVVPSGDLLDLVERVLNHTGHGAACMAIHQHRQFRELLRRRLMVASPRVSDGRYVQRRWNKAHVVRNLRHQHGLEPPVARHIASRVEELLFSCGLRVVTSGLVGEMIKSELLAWGLMAGALVVKKTRPRRPDRRIKDKSDSA